MTPLAAPPEPPPAIVQTDPQALYEAAVADRRAGRHQQALERLESVLAAQPDHVDARLNLGLAQLALNRLSEAETSFRAVLARAPDYAEAHAGLARVAQRRNDPDAARLEAAEAIRLAPNDPEIRALWNATRPQPQWRFDVDVTRSRLSDGLPDWTEARLAASRSLGDGWSTGLAAEWTERFGDSDLYLEGRAERGWNGRSLYVAVGGAPDADYRPELAVSFGGRLAIAQRLTLGVDGAVARYGVGTVVGLHPVAAFRVTDQLELTGRWINVRDENGELRSGYAVSGYWQAADRLGVRLGYADAPESSEGVTVDVRTWSLGADIGLTDRVALRFSGLSEDRGAYQREALSVGLGWRF